MERPDNHVHAIVGVTYNNHLGVHTRATPRDQPFWKFHFGQSPRDLGKFCFMAHNFFGEKSEKWSKNSGKWSKKWNSSTARATPRDLFRSPRDPARPPSVPA